MDIIDEAAFEDIEYFKKRMLSSLKLPSGMFDSTPYTSAVDALRDAGIFAINESNVWGDTAKNTSSALDRVNARRLKLYTDRLSKFYGEVEDEC